MTRFVGYIYPSQSFRGGILEFGSSTDHARQICLPGARRTGDTPVTGFEISRCEPILDALVGAGFLTRGRDGRFRRPSD
jgi:hypothetical protein